MKEFIKKNFTVIVLVIAVRDSGNSRRNRVDSE